MEAKALRQNGYRQKGEGVFRKACLLKHDDPGMGCNNQTYSLDILLMQPACCSSITSARRFQTMVGLILLSFASDFLFSRSQNDSINCYFDEYIIKY